MLKKSLDSHVIIKDMDRKTFLNRGRISPAEVGVYILVLLLIAWNIHLQICQQHMNEEIDAMKTVQDNIIVAIPDVSLSRDSKISLRTKRDLKARTFGDSADITSGNQRTLSDETELQHRLDYLNEDERTARIRRNAQDARQRSRRLSKAHKKKQKKNKSKASAAHFMAHIDEDRLNRERAEGLNHSQGQFTANGFKPTGRIYKIWKPAEWTNHDVFRYDTTTGKVTIKSSGLYLVYGQVMYHSPAARNTYGIHINDELVPFIQALAFDNIHSRQETSGRTKRSLSELVKNRGNTTQTNDREAVGDDLDLSQSVHRVRHSRSPKHNTYSSYHQCNTIAVTRLKRHDHVFLRSVEDDRTIIPTKALTFWGMVKL